MGAVLACSLAALAGCARGQRTGGSGGTGCVEGPGIKCGANPGVSHQLVCNKKETVYTNTHTALMCVIIDFSDQCPGANSVVTISGLPGSTSVPDKDSVSLALKVPAGATVSFECKGEPTNNPNESCAWTFQQDHETTAGEECRAR